MNLNINLEKKPIEISGYVNEEIVGSAIDSVEVFYKGLSPSKSVNSNNKGYYLLQISPDIIKDKNGTIEFVKKGFHYLKIPKIIDKSKDSILQVDALLQRIISLKKEDSIPHFQIPTYLKYFSIGYSFLNGADNASNKNTYYHSIDIFFHPFKKTFNQFAFGINLSPYYQIFDTSSFTTLDSRKIENDTTYFNFTEKNKFSNRYMITFKIYFRDYFESHKTKWLNGFVSYSEGFMFRNGKLGFIINSPYIFNKYRLSAEIFSCYSSFKFKYNAIKNNLYGDAIVEEKSKPMQKLLIGFSINFSLNK